MMTSSRKTPSTTNDSSVQFSLGELMKLEDERQAEQAREDRAREERARSAKLEAQRIAENEARAEAERARREELDAMARREAMHKASVEQARLEVETRARMEEREMERRHDMEIARLQAANIANAAKKPPAATMGGLAGATLLGGALMLLVTLAVYFGSIKPANDRQLADLDARIAAADKRIADADKRSDDQLRTLEAITGQRDQARAESENLKIALHNATVNGGGGGKKTNPHPGGPMPGGPVPPGPRPHSGPDCDPHDPMCFALPK